MAATLGTVQPFRYRGYVYDEETKLYYLRSRYYNANQQRFLNADVLLPGNLYAYCVNIPVSSSDDDGCVMAWCLNENGFLCTTSTMIMDGCCGGAYTIAYASRRNNSSGTTQRYDGVSFEPNEDGNGGRINNSHKLNLWEAIAYTECLEEQYGDIYKGSDVGYYFELFAHNLGYDAIDTLNTAIDLIEPAIGIEDLTVGEDIQNRLASVDFGATIYSDYEDHGALSYAFFIPYGLVFPVNSIYDLYVHYTNAQ